jgi:hypothetical protein
VAKFDPVKAATLSSLLKQGVPEDEALRKAGITDDDFGIYVEDDVVGSPTRGQIIPGPGYSEAEQARAAQRQQRAAQDSKAWADDEIKSQRAGPIETRTETTTTTTVTGGAERVTQMTPEMRDWSAKATEASRADSAASQAAREEYLRSRGLDQASPAAKRAAIREAEAGGKSFEVTTNKDALGEPPAKQYTTEVIQPNPTGIQTPNDGTLTPDAAAKKSAQGQTAEDQINNTETPNQAAQPLSDEEKANLEKNDSGETASKINQAEDPSAASKQNDVKGTAAQKSESNFSADASATDAANSVVGNNVTGKTSEYASLSPSAVPENVLHKYTSYTYRLSLFFLTAKDYNNLAASPTTFKPRYSLISSGGGFSMTKTDLEAEKTKTGKADYTQTTRHPDFQTDFFIDNLSLQTIVGLNAKSKASNTIDISFTITEPYGLSLLDRLLSACETSEDKSVNYMSQPYLLQIDLLASPTDAEVTATPGSNNVISTKKIAIKLLEMKIKPTGSGTTYSCRAMPFNHSAFDTTTASLPVAMSVEAGTVGEFFSSDDDLVKLFTGEIKADEERIEKEIDDWIKKNTIIFANQKPTPEQIENQRKALLQARKFKSKSLAAAYNGYMSKISEEKKLSKFPPTKIAFNIPNNDIAKSPIVNASQSSTSDVRMQDTTTGVNQADSSGFKNKQTFTFNPGTSIIEVIDTVMSKSEYVKKQILTQQSQENTTAANNEYSGSNERTASQTKNAALKWYKILPTVALNDFDSSTNTYSKTVLYSILPYSAANSYHPNFAKITSGNVADSVVRTYDYLYTGKNKDVLRLDIDFDTSFYTLVTTKGDQVKRAGNDAGSDTSDSDEDKYATSRNTTPPIPPVFTAFTGSNKSSVGTAKATDPDEQTIADMKSSIYTRQRGDALNIKLQITGDPDFIKQDDIFFNPGSPSEYAKLLENRLANNSKRPISSDGQILFDAEQVYVRVNVKNAVDIDDSIGIVNKQEVLSNGRTTNGSFSGVYKVLTVQSDFSRGQFTQTLDLIRMPDDLPAPKKIAKQKPITAIDTNDTSAAAFGKRIDAPFATAPAPEPAAPPVETPTQPSDVAQVKQPQTYAEAFKQARKDFGNKPGGTFEWRGKLYQTNYQNEPYVTNPKPVYPGANQ